MKRTQMYKKIVVTDGGLCEANFGDQISCPHAKANGKTEQCVKMCGAMSVQKDDEGNWATCQIGNIVLGEGIL